MNGCEKRLTVWVAYGVLDRTLYRCRLAGTTFKLHPNSLIDDGTGLGLEPVGGEFQPSFETVHPGGGAHLVRLCPLGPLSRLCQAKDVTQILFPC